MTKSVRHFAYDVVGRSARSGNVVFSRSFKRVTVKDIDAHMKKYADRLLTSGIVVTFSNIVDLDAMKDVNTFTLDGERITVTQHGKNDLSIHFENGDFSVRGSMLDVVKTFAEWQASTMPEPVVSFEWLDRSISNPWLDPSARFQLDNPTACTTYGEDNVLQFIIDACTLLRPTEKKGR